MSQKVRDITVTVVVEDGDEGEVLESVDSWVYNHAVGMRWGCRRPHVSEPRDPTPDEAAGFMLD